MVRVLLPLFLAISVSAQPCTRGLETLTELTDDRVYAVAAADFDEDGRTDLAQLELDLVVRLNRGAGIFERVAELEAENNNYVVKLYAVDVDADGHIDLLTYYTAQVTFYRGRGDGTFAAPLKSQINPISRVRLEDLNGDGRPDFFMAGTAKLVFATATADGTFVTAGSTPVDSAWEGSPWTLGDFDGDGDLDGVLMPLNTPLVLFAWNEGGFRFTQQYWVPAATQTGFAIAAVDVDGDGVVEAVGKSHGGLLVVRVPGRKFSSSVIPYNGQLGELSPIRGGDFDGDGRQDIVFIDPAGVGVAWGRENADAPFTVNGYDLPANQGVVVADLDGDGADDLASAPGEGILTVHGIPGTRRLRGSPYWSAWPRISGALLADIDGDGRRDLVAQETDTNVTVLFAAQAGGGMTPRKHLTGVRPAAAGDFDGDGHADLLVRSNEPPKIMFGDGNWNFPASVVTSLKFATGVLPATIGGRLGMIVHTDTEILTLTVSSGRGVTIAPIGTVGPAPYVDVTDIDGDGDSDVVTWSYGGKVKFILQTETGWQARETPYRSDMGRWIGADMNNDGRQDLVFADTTYSYSVLLQQADGTYKTVARLDGKGFAVADMDRDGFLDVVVDHDRAIMIHRNRGDGVPMSYSRMASGTGRILAIEDYDGDGWPDVGTMSMGFVALRNVCAPSRVSAVAMPAVAREGEPVELLVQTLNRHDYGQLTVRLGDRVLSTNSILVPRIALPPLGLGTHTLTVEVTQKLGGTSTATATVHIVSGHKRRAVR